MNEEKISNLKNQMVGFLSFSLKRVLGLSTYLRITGDIGGGGSSGRVTAFCTHGPGLNPGNLFSQAIGCAYRKDRAIG